MPERILSATQLELLEQRKAKFDDWLAERMPVLREFAALLELPNPALIVEDPGLYLPPIDAWLERQTIEEEHFAWVTSRIAYFSGEILIQRFSGCWLVCESPASRFFARFVVGRFRDLPNPDAIADPVEMAATFASELPGRSLIRALENVSSALVSF